MFYLTVKMKNLNVLWIFGYIFLLVKNWSIVNACDTDEYEGALCFNTEAIRRLAPSIEAQFYDEATGIFNKGKSKDILVHNTYHNLCISKLLKCPNSEYFFLYSQLPIFLYNI